MADDRVRRNPFLTFLRFFLYVLMIVLTLCAGGWAALLTYANQNGSLPSFYGYSIFVSDEDAGTLPARTVAILDGNHLENLQIGDDIVYRTRDTTEQEHPYTAATVQAMLQSGDPPQLFVDQGNGLEQGRISLLQSQVVGKIVYKDAAWGAVLLWLQTPAGICTALFTPLVLLLLFEVLRYSLCYRKRLKQMGEESDATDMDTVEEGLADEEGAEDSAAEARKTVSTSNEEGSVRGSPCSADAQEAPEDAKRAEESGVVQLAQEAEQHTNDDEVLQAALASRMENEMEGDPMEVDRKTEKTEPAPSVEVLSAVKSEQSDAPDKDFQLDALIKKYENYQKIRTEIDDLLRFFDKAAETQDTSKDQSDEGKTPTK